MPPGAVQPTIIKRHVSRWIRLLQVLPIVSSLASVAVFLWWVHSPPNAFHIIVVLSDLAVGFGLGFAYVYFERLNFVLPSLIFVYNVLNIAVLNLATPSDPLFAIMLTVVAFVVYGGMLLAAAYEESSLSSYKITSERFIIWPYYAVAIAIPLIMVVLSFIGGPFVVYVVGVFALPPLVVSAGLICWAAYIITRSQKKLVGGISIVVLVVASMLVFVLSTDDVVLLPSLVYAVGVLGAMLVVRQNIKVV